MSAAKGGMTAALVSPVKPCLWLCRVSREMDGFQQSGPWQEAMVLLWLSMGDQMPACSCFPAVLTALDLLHPGAPWQRASLTP